MDFTQRDLHWAVHCVSGLLDRRRVRYEPIPASLVQAHRRLTAAYAAMSAGGPENGSQPAQLDERIGSSEAAAILGVSPRHVRRLAADIDGVKVGTWTFSRAAVERYARGRQHK